MFCCCCCGNFPIQNRVSKSIGPTIPYLTTPLHPSSTKLTTIIDYVIQSLHSLSLLNLSVWSRIILLLQQLNWLRIHRLPPQSLLINCWTLHLTNYSVNPFENLSKISKKHKIISCKIQYPLTVFFLICYSLDKIFSPVHSSLGQLLKKTNHN